MRFDEICIYKEKILSDRKLFLSFPYLSQEVNRKAMYSFFLIILNYTHRLIITYICTFPIAVIILFHFNLHIFYKAKVYLYK